MLIEIFTEDSDGEMMTDYSPASLETVFEKKTPTDGSLFIEFRPARLWVVVSSVSAHSTFLSCSTMLFNILMDKLGSFCINDVIALMKHHVICHF